MKKRFAPDVYDIKPNGPAYEIYLAEEVDTRIGELETAGREYVTRTDQLIEANHARIDELETLLREIADNGGDLLTEDLIQRMHKSLMETVSP